MKKDEVRGLVRLYLARYEDFNKQIKDEYFGESISFIRKFKDSQLSTFLADAITLKDIVLNDKQVCKEPKLITLNQQYYLLSEKQLISYLSFRTFAKRGAYLKNNHPYNFLLMYLMEIVNGIHGDLIDKKCKLLHSVLGQFINEENEENEELYENCLELIDDAYNIVYIQNINTITKEAFENKYSEVLDDTTLDDENTLENHQVLITHVLQLTNLDNNDNFTQEEKKLIRFSFESICTKIDEMDFLYFDFLYLPELFEISYEEEIFNSFTQIKALYPVSVDVEFIDLNKMVKEIFKYGIHSSSRLYFKDEHLNKINFFFRLIINTINHHLYDVPLPIVNSDSLINCPDRLYSVMLKEYKDSQKVIDDVVGNWFTMNPYVKVLYKEGADEELIEYIIKHPEEAKKRFAAFEKGLPFNEDELDENGDMMDANDIMIRDWNFYLENVRDPDKDSWP